MKYIKYIFLFLLITLMPFQSFSEEKLFDAYPGEYAANMPKVLKANIVTLTVEVWSGFPKRLQIKLPGIDVPTVTSKSTLCENELAAKAMVFTEKFVNESKWFKVKNIQMVQTNQPDGVANITTDLGSLSIALSDAGLARSSQIDKKTFWCQ